VPPLTPQLIPMIAFGSNASRVGKDTAAKFALEFGRELFGAAARLSFSSSIKSVSHDLFGCHGLQPGPFYELPENEHLRTVKLPVINRSPLEIWIMVGDKMREIHEDVWIDQARAVVNRDPEQPSRVFLNIESSLRFPNECSWISERGGWCVKIFREGAPVYALDRKIPESYSWDRVLTNDGTKEELRDKIREVVEDYHRYWLYRQAVRAKAETLGGEVC